MLRPKKSCGLRHCKLLSRARIGLEREMVGAIISNRIVVIQSAPLAVIKAVTRAMISAVTFQREVTSGLV